MELQVAIRGDRIILEGPPGKPLLNAEDDVVLLVEACFNYRARLALLYAENLTEPFFDLSSGDAGTILQKLRSYHIRLALVAAPGQVRQSDYFRAMVAEERGGRDFRIFEDRAAAERW